MMPAGDSAAKLPGPDPSLTLLLLLLLAAPGMGMLLLLSSALLLLLLLLFMCGLFNCWAPAGAASGAVGGTLLGMLLTAANTGLLQLLPPMPPSAKRGTPASVAVRPAVGCCTP